MTNKTCKGWLYLFCLLIFALLMLPQFLSPYPSTTTDSQQTIQRIKNLKSIKSITSIKNIQAFARLYGYIRFFHPSDEATQVNWDRFAVYGVKEVATAATTTELKETLERLFLPIAPSLILYLTEENPQPRFSPSLITPPNRTQMKEIYWQYQGLNLSREPTIFYNTVRVNRDKHHIESNVFGNIIKRLDATSFRGKKFWLKAMVKTVKGSAQLWFRVDCFRDRIGFFDNMVDRPIISRDWGHFEIRGTIDDDAQSLNFGCFLFGEGKIYIDDFQLLINDNNKWRTIPLDNGDFEGPVDKHRVPAHWTTAGDSYQINVLPGCAYKSRKCVMIKSNTKMSLPHLFPDIPKPGDYIEKEIGNGISCIIPLALYGSKENTYPQTQRGSLEKLVQKINQDLPGKLSTSNIHVRWANILITWNIMQHFHPYIADLDSPWQERLPEYLEKSTRATDVPGFLFTLNQMLLPLQDGQITIAHPFLNNQSTFPFRVQFVQDQVVISTTQDPMFERGDIILAIDGVEVSRLIRDLENQVPGSRQWKRENAMRLFGRGPGETTALIRVLRSDKIYEFTASRDSKSLMPLFEHEPIYQVSKNIYYVDLTGITIEQFERVLPQLAHARGLVFDARGRVGSKKHQVLAYLIREPITTSIFHTPEVVFPDQEKIHYTDRTLTITPKRPRLKARSVFLVNAGTVSTSEVLIEMVQHYQLGEIVGQETAGASGSFNMFTLPGDYTVKYTGMRVLNHERELVHLQGIQPAIVVEPTFTGIIQGRDEILERALTWLEENMLAREAALPPELESTAPSIPGK